MRKVLAIDYGKKRHGLAISDALGLMAHARDYLEAHSPRLWQDLSLLVESEDVDRIIVGMPRTLQGDKGIMATEVDQFIEKLRSHFTLDIIEWDERLSTAQVEKALVASDMKRKKRKEHRDSLAARLILQSYLDHLAHHA